MTDLMTASTVRRQNALAKKFYDELASEFDAMTDYQARLGRETPAFEKLVHTYDIHRAVDVGCGTGVHSIILARLGVEVIGTDISPAMLRRAQQHAREENLAIKFLRASMTEFARKIRKPKPVDAIFCLGNSIAHLTSDDDFSKTLRRFYQILKPGGVAIIHQLNPAMLEAPLHLASLREAHGTWWQRFYLSLRGEHYLCWLRLQKNGGGWKHLMVSTRVRLRERRELVHGMRRCGFRRMQFLASLQGGQFQARRSRDLYVFAHR